MSLQMSTSKFAAWLVLALIGACASSSDAIAQVNTTLISGDRVRPLGLEEMWHSQIDFDPAMGKLAGITQFISTTEVQYIYEVTYPEGRIAISERDLDTFSRPLGQAGAKKKAEDWVKRYQARTKSTQNLAIVEHVVPDVIIVATSERGIIQCLNGETGRTYWTTKIGSVNHPTMVSAVNDEYVAAVNGSTLFMLKRKDGTVVWEGRTKHSPGAGPALSDQLAFVPMVNGMMEVYDLSDFTKQPTEFRSFGRITVKPVVFADAVAWPTEKGLLYVGNSEVPGIRFRISAHDRVSAAPTFLAGDDKTPMTVFFASVDGYLYFVDTDKGDILRRFSTGEPITQTPIVVQDRIYVITDNGTLFCVGVNDAEERWSQSGIKSFLSANTARIYCLDRQNRLVSIDSKTGSRLGSASLGGVDFSFANTVSDRIYLGTSSGVLQCFRESKQNYPLVHATHLKQQVASTSSAKPKTKAPAADAAEAETTTEEDPFGAGPKKTPPAAVPAEDDPFGAAPAKPAAKKPEPAAAEDDPFK